MPFHSHVINIECQANNARGCTFSDRMKRDMLKLSKTIGSVFNFFFERFVQEDCICKPRGHSAQMHTGGEGVHSKKFSGDPKYLFILLHFILRNALFFTLNSGSGHPIRIHLLSESNYGLCTVSLDAKRRRSRNSCMNMMDHEIMQIFKIALKNP